MLGLKMGDSITYQEQYDNGQTGKVQVCFDGSGLDMTRTEGLTRLVECHVETGLKGSQLLTVFASRYSYDGYLQVYRGNRILQTSEPTNAIRDYMKHPF